MPKPGKRGWSRLIAASGYSKQGFVAAWRHEEAFRQEVKLALILLPAAFWVGDTAVEQALLLMTCLIVLLTEIVNSAIEAVVDRFGDEYHELAGRAKDMGSAAVFISLTTLVLVWGMIGWSHLSA